MSKLQNHVRALPSSAFLRASRVQSYPHARAVFPTRMVLPGLAVEGR